MNTNFPIIIPSLGRAGSAPTAKWIDQANRPVIWAVHEDEQMAYERAYPDHMTVILPEETRKHTGLIRKQLMLQIMRPFFFVDDDIRISLKGTTEISKVFDLLEHHIECGASMAGIGQQLFSNAAMEKVREINGDVFAMDNKFVATVYAIQPMDFLDCPLEDLPVYEDVALVIHAMQRGGCICSYVATHSNVSPPNGGCNSWRDEAVTLQCLLKLVELYPEYCSVRETTNKTHSQEIGFGLRTAYSKIRKI